MNKLLSFQHNENQTPFPKIVANNIHCQSVENETEPKVHFEEFGEYGRTDDPQAFHPKRHPQIHTVLMMSK